MGSKPKTMQGNRKSAQGLVTTLTALYFSSVFAPSMAFPTLSAGSTGGALGDAGATWVPALGVDLGIGDSFSARHLMWGFQRGFYLTQGSLSSASYNFPLTKDGRAFRFRLGGGYAHRTTSVVDSKEMNTDSLPRKYSRGYIFLSNGFSAQANLGIFYAAFEFEGIFYPNALLPFYRGHGFDLFAGLAIGVSL